jgi:hypothetical protein
MGIFLIESSARADLGPALQSFEGADAIWTPTIFYFIHSG